MFLTACTALKCTHHVPGCVYCLKAYALCPWLRVLPWSVRTMFLAACTALKRTHYVPGWVNCFEACALCSWLRVLPSSVRTIFLAACTAFERTECYVFFDNWTNARTTVMFRIHQYHWSVGFPYCSVWKGWIQVLTFTDIFHYKAFQLNSLVLQ